MAWPPSLRTETRRVMPGVPVEQEHVAAALVSSSTRFGANEHVGDPPAVSADRRDRRSQPVAWPPSLRTDTRRVTPVSRSNRNTSDEMLVSSSTRSSANDE